MPNWGGDAQAGPSTAMGLLRRALDSPQAEDPTFERLKGARHARPEAGMGEITEVHVYPGIAFMRKRPTEASPASS
jgi:hypothetical protein